MLTRAWNQDLRSKRPPYLEDVYPLSWSLKVLICFDSTPNNSNNAIKLWLWPGVSGGGTVQILQEVVSYPPHGGCCVRSHRVYQLPPNKPLWNSKKIIIQINTVGSFCASIKDFVNKHLKLSIIYIRYLSLIEGRKNTPELKQKVKWIM